MLKEEGIKNIWKRIKRIVYSKLLTIYYIDVLVCMFNI